MKSLSSRRSWFAPYRRERCSLQVVPLEDRLAAGDALLSAVLGASWLGLDLLFPQRASEHALVQATAASAPRTEAPARNAPAFDGAFSTTQHETRAHGQTASMPAFAWDNGAAADALTTVAGRAGAWSDNTAAPAVGVGMPLFGGQTTGAGFNPNSQLGPLPTPPVVNPNTVPLIPARFLLFSDNFEDGNANGWTTYQGTWSVVTDGTAVYRQSGTSSVYRAAAGAANWTNYTVEARVKPTAWNGSDRAVGLLARFRDVNNTYTFFLRSSNTVELSRTVAGTTTSLVRQAFTVNLNTWHTLKLEVAGATLRGYVNGALQATATDATFHSGRIGFRTDYASSNFDDVVVSTGPAVNQPPQVNAGPDQVVILPAEAQLTGRVTDDGLPNPPATVTCLWSQTGGPGTVTFTPSATVFQPRARFSEIGAYTLRLTCSDSLLQASDSVNLNVLNEPPPPSSDVIGWASVDAWGQNGTTGGAGGPVVTVSTATEFLDYIARPGPHVIQVSGMIPLPRAMHNVSSHKTIIGLGSTAGLSGGGLNVGLTSGNFTDPPPNAIKNVIIRNLTFTGSPDDAINVQMFSHHVWIDHNTLTGAYDGLIDIKRGSNYITVSWNHTHHHTKNMLLGHSDSNGPQDIGRLKITYHHNWFDGTPQRNPRARFGEPIHVFNNYYYRNSDVGVACQANSGCVVEGNYFESVEEPMSIHYAGPTGRIVERQNVYVNSGPPDVGGTVDEPGRYYAYRMDNPADIKTIVMEGAGVGRIGS